MVDFEKEIKDIQDLDLEETQELRDYYSGVGNRFASRLKMDTAQVYYFLARECLKHEKELKKATTTVQSGNQDLDSLKLIKKLYEYHASKLYLKALRDNDWNNAKEIVDKLSRDALEEAHKWIMNEPVNNYDFRLRLSSYITNCIKDRDNCSKVQEDVPDWVLKRFQEMDDRLKAMEGQSVYLTGQVKEMNKSCSEMHESFNKLVKEMTDLYHGEEYKLKLIENCLERVERKLWPKGYEAKDKNPFAHWILKVTAKRPVSGWDCNKCKEDGTNGGDCENCYKCNEGSEFTPID